MNYRVAYILTLVASAMYKFNDLAGECYIFPSSPLANILELLTRCGGSF